MKIFEIIEARSNPQLNPKLHTLDQLVLLRKKHGDKQLYVSFTTLNKLGINPQSEFHTPNGIYSYPINYVIKNYNKIPYASEGRYAQVFYNSGKMFSIKTATKELAKEECEKVDQITGLVNNHYYNWVRDQYLEKNTYAGTALWHYIFVVSAYLTKDIPEVYNKPYNSADPEDPERVPVRVPVSLKAAEIWRKLGYTSVLDTGSGTIHKNEPTQAVFFSLNSLTHVTTLMNDIKNTDLTREKETASKDQNTDINSWIDMYKKNLTTLMVNRLSTENENKLLRSVEDDNRAATAMATYAVKFMRSQRLPASLENIINKYEYATKIYAKKLK